MGTETQLTNSLLDILQPQASAVDSARQRAEEIGGDIIDQLLVSGDISEEELLEALAEVSGHNAADPSDYDRVDRDAFETLDEDVIREHAVVPFRKHRRSLAVFVTEPLSEEVTDAIADEYRITLSQFVWPRVRHQEALHSLLDEPLDDWIEPFVTEAGRHVCFENNTTPDSERDDVDLDSLGVNWSREDTLEFLRNCFDRDALLYTLLGFSQRWLTDRMVLVLGHERAQPYLIAGWSELDEELRDLQTLRRVKIDIPADAVLFDPQHVGHSVAEMPEDVGLGQLFVELKLFPPDKLLVQTVRIGSRPSMAVIGEPDANIPSVGPLEEVARAVGDQLEELVRLAKARQLPPSDERIPPVPEPSEAVIDDDDEQTAVPGMAETSSSIADEEDNPGATAFGIPFADEAGQNNGNNQQRSAVEVSSPGISEESNVSIMQPVDIDEDRDEDPAQEPSDPLDSEDVRSTMSGGFSVVEFEKKLDEDDEGEPSDVSEAVDEPSEAADAPEEPSKPAAPMAQILRPISLKKKRAKAKAKREEEEASESDEPSDDDEPEPAAPAEDEAPEPDEASHSATDQDDLYVDSNLDVEGFPSVVIEGAIEDPADEPVEDPGGHDELGSSSSFVEDLEHTAKQLDSDQPHEAFAAAEQIASFGTQAMHVLEDRFPGRLMVDRYQYTIDTLPPVNEHGPVLAALATAGEQAVPVVASFLNHTSVELRFYATYLFTKLPIDQIKKALIPRLFDRDQQTRAIAKGLIVGQRSTDWFKEEVLPVLYETIEDGTEDLRVEVAADLLGAMRDRKAVPLLIESLERHQGRVKSHIHAALQAITYKNFVPSATEWKNWWVDAVEQSRHDWLVAALNSTSDDIRNLVFREVQEFDGLELNYHPDQPAKLRGRAQDELRNWLKQG